MSVVASRLGHVVRMQGGRVVAPHPDGEITPGALLEAASLALIVSLRTDATGCALVVRLRRASEGSTGARPAGSF